MNQHAGLSSTDQSGAPTPAPAIPNTHHGIGAPVERLEDPRLITGNGRFAANLHDPQELHAFILRSPVGHARIRNIDMSAVAGHPGLVAILTSEDYLEDGLGEIPCVSIPPTITGKTWHKTPFLPLARDRVLCVGAEIAVIVAETRAIAEDVAEHIVVDYEPLPVVPTLEHAIAPGAALVWPDAAGNRCFRHDLGDAAATDAAFKQAVHVVRGRIRNQRVAGTTLEPRTCVGRYDRATQRWHLTTSTSNPHRIRLLLAEHIFKVPAHRVHVVAGDVGGGFGTKGGIYPEEALIAWAAQRVGRTVKWVCDRSEAFVADFNGRDQIADAEMALDGDGRILGLRVEVYHNLGCMLGPSSAHPPLIGMRMISGVYAIPAIHVGINGIFTNSRTLTTYRGAGRPEATMVIEQMMDHAAARLGIDRVEIRRRNFIRPEQMPYRTAVGETYDCGEFEAITDAALALGDWDGFPARRARSEARGLLRGRGISCYVELCATVSDRMEVRFDPTGGVSILAGTFSYGQGHETSFAQMIHEWLDVPLDQIRLVQGDTDIIANGRGSFGSRSMTIGGSALKQACDEIVAKGMRVAAILLDCDIDDLTFDEGYYHAGKKSISLDQVARTTFAWGQPRPLPADLRNGLDGVGYFSADTQNYPNGCYVAEVEVDPETGEIRVDRIGGVDDVGVVINPLLLEGQVIGGIAQALGQALKEGVVHDEQGQVLTGSLTDYAMPHAADFPRIMLDTRAVPTATNPLGVKGGAETGTIGLPPAIVGAALDALAPLGVRDLAMPLTPHRIWTAIAAARAEKETA